MFKSAVVFVLWLTSVTLTVGRQCNCHTDSVGCGVYTMATVMTKSLDKVAGNTLFSPYGLWTGLMDASHISKGIARHIIYSILYGSPIITCNKHIYDEYLVNHDIRNGIYNEEAAPFWFHLTTFVPGNPDLLQYYVTKRYGNTNYNVYFINTTTFDGTLKATFEQFDANLKPNIVVTKNTNFVILTNTRIKDKWRSPFKTTTEDKYNGKRITMMQTSGIFFHSFDKKQGTRYVFLECEQSELLMVLVLTDSKQSQAETSWDMLNSQDKQTAHLNVSIPKFKFKGEYSFIQVIYDSPVGATKDFHLTRDSDFSGINGISAPLSQVVQKSVVSIDEEGVTFEAYTMLLSDPLETPAVGQVMGSEGDKSYTFYLIYREMVVAQGRIADPSS